VGEGEIEPGTCTRKKKRERGIVKIPGGDKEEKEYKLCLYEKGVSVRRKWQEIGKHRRKPGKGST